jgi:ABC-type multidrug transport system permease subunit
VLLALSAVALMLVIGVVAYDVQIIGRTVLATVGTLVVGIAGLAALGLAVGALAPSAASGQTISVAAAVALSFISGMFVVGAQTPAWMETVASIFPIRHLVTALQDQFNPFLSGPGWDPPGLAVIAAWALISLFAASWALRREPRPTKGTNRSEPSNVALPGLAASRPGRPRGITLAVDQTRWANRSAWRDAGWIFFAMAMPVGLYALMTTMYGSTFRPNDMPFAFFFACGMTAYGIAVTAFINMPEAVARARDSLVLKRLRGTPVTAFQYLTGRTASVVWIGLVTAVLVFGVAAAFFAARLDVAGIPSAVLVLLVGTLSLAACGYALVAVIPNAKSMGAVGLGILLPLSFFSDVFLIGGAPEWMGTIGSFFPLRHFVHGLATALDPAGTALPWANLAVLTAWLALAALIAIRRFRWEPAG